MNSTLYNIIVYFCLLFRGPARLDKTRNDIHDKLILVGFILLFVFAIIGFCAICFLIKPPEYYSTTLA